MTMALTDVSCSTVPLYVGVVCRTGQKNGWWWDGVWLWSGKGRKTNRTYDRHTRLALANVIGSVSSHSPCCALSTKSQQRSNIV